MRQFIFLIVIFPFILVGNPVKVSTELNPASKGDTNIRFDKSKNIYSNYLYSVSFDGPDHWQSDFGISKHTIFRTYDADTGTTFSINIIEADEFMPGLDLPSVTTMWNVYQEKDEFLDSLTRISLKKAYNIDDLDLKRDKGYISNHVALKNTLRYMNREVDYEYELTVIQFQVLRKRRVYTFTLSIPSVFYKDKARYYDYLIFQKINFLFDVSDQ